MMPPSPAPLITLTTDFGTRDAYVAAMKGVLLSIAPGARLVDVTHEVAPQDVMEAAFVLRRAAPFFPPEAVHLVVVDPGVGTERRGVALRSGPHRYVGPDNGLFCLVLGDRPPDELVVLDRPEMWRAPEVSGTFHGRDVFAPVAAHLAAGRALGEVGTPVDAAAEPLERLHWASPIPDDEGLTGRVIHVDHFGNCITNISRTVFDRHLGGRAFKCYAGAAILRALQPTYGAVPAGEPVLLFESSGSLEIAVREGNASEQLGIRRGASVHLVFADVR